VGSHVRELPEQDQVLPATGVAARRAFSERSQDRTCRAQTPSMNESRRPPTESMSPAQRPEAKKTRRSGARVGPQLAGMVMLLASGITGGCGTAAGDYLWNRARDLGECFRVEAGCGVGVGGGVRVAGLATVGLGGGAHVFPGAGWRWGRPVLRGPGNIHSEFYGLYEWTRGGTRSGSCSWA
jgi:hypothetical protein